MLRLRLGALLFLLLLFFNADATNRTATESCRQHLAKVATKFCPNTKCVEKAAVELAKELSLEMEDSFSKVEDFCCSRMCTHEDLKKICCVCRKRKHTHHHRH